MAGLTGRMSTVVKAKVSKLLDRAEDPAETLDYSYQKQVEQLQNVKKGIADVVTAKKRLQMQESSLQQSVVKLDTQARQALAAGQEDLARTALERKNVAQTELQGPAMQRAVDKTENMRARADAVSELEAAGTFDDITQLGSGEDDIDRQLKQLSSQPAVDDELAKMKGELGQAPAAPAAQIPAPSGDAAEAPP